MRTLSDISGNKSNCYKVTDPVSDIFNYFHADDEEGAKDLFIVFALGADSPDGPWNEHYTKIRDGLIVEKGNLFDFAEESKS